MSLAAYNKSLIKSNFPWINIFNHEVPVIINAMRDITVGLFEHLEIPPKLDLYLSNKYTNRILRLPALENIWHILLDYKESSRGFDGYQWTLVSAKSATM